MPVGGGGKKRGKGAIIFLFGRRKKSPYGVRLFSASHGLHGSGEKGEKKGLFYHSPLPKKRGGEGLKPLVPQPLRLAGAANEATGKKKKKKGEQIRSAIDLTKRRKRNMIVFWEFLRLGSSG